MERQMIKSEEKHKKRFLPFVVAGIALAVKKSQARSKKKAQKAAASATTKFESSGDKTIDEMMKWVKEMMTEYSKGEGQRKSIDNVMASGNRGAVRTTGGEEFAIAKRAQARLKDRFPRYIKAVLDYVNQTESFYENARSVISEVRSQVLPRG
ncbi:hypothetical protein FOZ62_025173, partial [Perkinsus olseni]